MKRMFKYFIAFILAYIIINVVSSLLIKSTTVKLDDKLPIGEVSEVNWEGIVKEPLVWFLAVGALVVTLP